MGVLLEYMCVCKRDSVCVYQCIQCLWGPYLWEQELKMIVNCNLGAELKSGPLKEQCVAPKDRVISPEPGFLSLESRRCPFAHQQRSEVNYLSTALSLDHCLLCLFPTKIKGISTFYTPNP